MDPQPSTSQSAAIRDEIHDTLATWESAYFANEEVVHINQGLLYDDDELYGILADNVEDTLENCSQGIETQEAHDLSFCEDFSSDNETEDVTTTREWHYGNAPNTNNLDFTATAGLKVDMREKEPIDFFFLILCPSILNLILTCTNRYGEDLKNAASAIHSRMKEWQAIDMGTLKTFIGLVIHMGTIQYSRMSDYWKTHYLFKNDIFRKYMPRNKFLNIMRALNVQNVAGNASLNKIISLIDEINKNMRNIYHPTREVTIDESLMLWRGRLSYRQYMKSKASGYGLKFYNLADNTGTIYKTHLYAGSKDPLVSGPGHTNKVVHLLIDDLKNMGHSLYVDNFYCSIPLTRELLNSRTFCTGTLKMNRKGNPKELLKTKIKKGECIILHDKNNITLAKWMDKREVLFLSSEHNSVLEEVRNRNRNSTSLKPRAIIKYNKYMRNVDKHDQMLSYYTGEHKSVRWYKKVIIHLIEVCLVNSYQLFKSEKKLNISLYDFRANILERLLPPIHPREEIPLAICPMHFPKQITKEPNSRRAKRKQCRQCAKQKKRVDTIFYCPNCPDQPGLCLNCFKPYHRY
ncbi:hypothetical protein HF086_000353 [Spodoptera exigua]|uniref:Transposase n=1 Tax=Spodoptera exigua TaxID=7107 RepID=A0A922MAG3_SPOEX|nr:hypothetical protein HF086_000353 [Spodoptera exigua]